MKKIDLHSTIPEFTLATNFRQKGAAFQLRRSKLFRRVAVRKLANLPGRPPRALMTMGPHHYPCAVGRSGIGVKRREGDGFTPHGRFLVLGWLRRPDLWKIFRPDSERISPTDGWCDDPRSNIYNRHIILPGSPSAEILWRDDGVYDVIGLLNFNWRPRILGRGSAIFLHLAHTDFRATAGCVALSRADMRKAQMLWSRRLQIDIGDFASYRRVPKMAEPTRT